MDKVYCETCDEWQPISRKATAAEAVGIRTPPQLDGLFSEPPF